MRSIALAVALLTAFVAASSAHGYTTSPNLVINGAFDAGIDGWQVQGQNASLAWSPDAGIPPGAALLQYGPDFSGARSAGASQCVPVVSGAFYVSQTQILLPSAGQAPDAEAGVFLAWFATADCSGFPIPADSGTFASPQADDQWHLSGFATSAPTDAQAVRVGVALVRFEDSGLPARVYFDGVSLVHLTADPPRPADRFENVHVRAQDVSGHVQIRVEVAPNGNYALHTDVLRAQGEGTYCVGFGYFLYDSTCSLPGGSLSLAGAAKDPLAFTREWPPASLPCLITFHDPRTFNIVAHARLNFAGCPG